MPRHERLNYPGCNYHVITRGLERRRLFKDNRDREEFLYRLGKALEETGSECHAWVLMDNHIHLLIRTGVRSLSEMMRKVLSGYAIYFNRRYKRHGYLFQNRYKSILCQEDVYYSELIRYIHLNPVRAGMVQTLMQLNKYPWTGHSVIVGNSTRPWQQVNDVLSYFARHGIKAIQEYSEYIKNGFHQGQKPELQGGGLVRSSGGWERLKELKRNKEYWRGDERILGDGDFVAAVLKAHEEKLTGQEKLKRAGWDLDRVSHHVCQLLSIDFSEIFRKGRANDVSAAKNLIAYWANQKLGLSGKEIADYFGLSRPAISYCIKQGKLYVHENDINLIF